MLRNFPGKDRFFFTNIGNKADNSLVFISEGMKNTFSYQSYVESATVVYPLLLNYGLSAVGVDSFIALRYMG